MTRSTVFTFALLLAAGPAAAQSTTPAGQPAPAGQPTPTAEARQDVKPEVTISGCLRSNSSTAATGSERAPAPAAQPVVFTVDVAPAHGASSAPQSAARTAEAGGVGTSGHDLAPATYTVAPAAAARVDLGKHVNHMVELTGHLREAAGPSTVDKPQTAPTPEMPEATDATAKAAARTFEVTGVREIAAACPAK